MTRLTNLRVFRHTNKLKLELQLARLHRHADLKIARVIPRAGQRRDFPLGQLGRKSLHTDVGKTHRRHSATQMRRAARRHRQRRNFSTLDLIVKKLSSLV